MKSDLLRVDFPVWTLASVARLKDQGGLSASVIAPLNDTEHGMYFPLFTTLDSAKRLIREMNLSGIAPMTLKAPEALQSLLSDLKKMGCLYVGRNISITETSITGEFYPIQEWLDSLAAEDEPLDS